MSLRCLEMRKQQRGAVAMETVILSVLIAAAVVVGIIVVGRTIVRSTDLATKSAAGKAELAGTAAGCPQKGYRKQAEDDVEQANKFPEELSDVKSKSGNQ